MPTKPADWVFTEVDGVVTYQALIGPRGGDVGVGGGLTETSPGSGIYIAQVANKVDTYANLKAYAGADGQLSTASDKNVLFRHTGVGGSAKPSYLNKHVLKSYLGAVGTVTSATANTFTALDLNDDSGSQLAFGNAEIWVVGTPTEIVLPVITSGQYLLSISGTFTFTANATGTVRRLRVEAWNGSAWVNADVSGASVNINTDAACSATNPVGKYVRPAGKGPSLANRFRITAAQSSGSTLTCAVQGVMEIDAFHID